MRQLVAEAHHRGDVEHAVPVLPQLDPPEAALARLVGPQRLGSVDRQRPLRLRRIGAARRAEGPLEAPPRRPRLALHRLAGAQLRVYEERRRRSQRDGEQPRHLCSAALEAVTESTAGWVRALMEATYMSSAVAGGAVNFPSNWARIT